MKFHLTFGRSKDKMWVSKRLHSFERLGGDKARRNTKKFEGS